MTEEGQLGTEPPSGAAPEPVPPVSVDTEPFVPAAPAVAAPDAPPPPAPAVPAPPVGWQPPPVAVAAKGERTTLAMAAGILLILGGIGGILLGLLVAIVGGTVISSLDFSQFNVPDLKGASPGAVAGGVVAFVGALVVAYSIAYLLAGIGVLRNSNWARVLGIIVGIISGVVWLSGLAGANNTQNAAGSAGAGLFSILALGIHVYIVVVLLFFWRSKPSVA
jgi:hypothetical protein